MAFLGFIGLKITLSVLSLATAFGSYLFAGIGYAITAFKQIHRSYAEYLMDKPELTLKDIDQILSQITRHSSNS